MLTRPFSPKSTLPRSSQTIPGVVHALASFISFWAVVGRYLQSALWLRSNQAARNDVLEGKVEKAARTKATVESVVLSTAG